MELNYKLQQQLAVEIANQFSTSDLNVLRESLRVVHDNERYNSGRGETLVSEALWRVYRIFGQAVEVKSDMDYQNFINPPAPAPAEEPVE